MNSQDIFAFQNGNCSLLCHLNFAMQVIPQGHSFISRLLNLSKTTDKLHDLIKLDAWCRSELHIWSILCNNLPSDRYSVFFNNEWFANVFSSELLSLPQNISSTALLELCTVIVACLLLSGCMRIDEARTQCRTMGLFNNKIKQRRTKTTPKGKNRQSAN